MTFKSALFAGAMLLGAANVASAAEKEILLATMAVPGTTVETASKLFAEKVSGALAGEVKVRVNDSLVKGGQLAPSIRDGVVGAVVAVHPYLSGSQPFMGLQNLPGLIKTTDDYQKALSSFWREDLKSIWSKDWNAVVLAEGAWSEHNLFVNKPIKSAKDFAGLKIRVHNAETARFINQLGALPTPLAAAEMAAGLERGVIDGMFTPSCYAYKQDLYRTAKYIEKWQIGPIQGWAILVNNDTWASLSEAQQKSLKKIGQDVEKEMWETFAQATEACVKGMQDNGAVFHAATEAEMSAIFTEDKTKPVYGDWVNRMKEKGNDGVEVLKKAKAAIGQM